MERHFEDFLKARRVDKKTMKALRNECITNVATLVHYSDSDINQLCAKHKISEDMKVLLKKIIRDEQNYSENHMVDARGTPSLKRYIIIAAIM